MKRFYPVVLLLLTVALASAANSQSSEPAASAPAISRDQPTSVSQSRPAAAAQTDPPQSTAEEPDPLLDAPPMPKGKVTLIGGTVNKVDRIREKIVVQVFGGGTMKLSFDERTHIYRDGVETTQLGIRNGDRVYIDTMLDRSRLFARNIRVETGARAADSAGQILSVNARDRIITLQDQLSSRPITFQINQKTSIQRDKQPASFSALKPGALVVVKFALERANHGMAREISIVASPGMQFTFAGKVTHLDLRLGTFSVENNTDGKTYDLKFSLARVDKRDSFGVGSEVTVLATFEAWGYQADNVTVTAAPEAVSRKQ
jgi:hypothetical protein